MSIRNNKIGENPVKLTFILSSIILVYLCLIIPPINAEKIQLQKNNLVLNAEYLSVHDKNKPLFLVLHGTFAWHGMELISTLQNNLLEAGYASLGITLSLSESNRVGFFDCKHPILSKHEDAQQEIGYWLEWLNKQGHMNIHIIAHSRGGAQAAQFVSDNQKSIEKVYLIAPQIWEAEKFAQNFKKTNKKELKVFLDDISLSINKNNEKKLHSMNSVLHCSNIKITAGAFSSYYSAIPEKNTINLLSKIKNPTIIYLGDSDPLTNDFNRLYDQFLSKNKNQNVKLKLIEDADHFFRDFAAEDIVEDIIKHVQ